MNDQASSNPSAYAARNSTPAISSAIARISSQAGSLAWLMSRNCRNGSIQALTRISTAPTNEMYAPGFTLIRPSESTEIAIRTSSMYSVRVKPSARRPAVASSHTPSFVSGPFSASSRTSASKARMIARICRPPG